MGIYNIIGTKDEKYIKDKLNKIIWFNTTQEFFNYVLIKGTKSYLKLESEDIIIIQQLCIEIAKEKELHVAWLYDIKLFLRKIEECRYWANYEKDKLIFKYKPSEETIKAYKDFDNKLHIYKKTAMNNLNSNNEYNELLKSFIVLINLL